MLQVQDHSLNLFTCSPVHNHYATATPTSLKLSLEQGITFESVPDLIVLGTNSGCFCYLPYSVGLAPPFSVAHFSVCISFWTVQTYALHKNHPGFVESSEVPTIMGFH